MAGPCSRTWDSPLIRVTRIRLTGPSSPRAFEPYRGYEHGPEYDTDFREQPTAYRVGRDDGGPFEVEPHKSELPPLWEIKTAPETEQGAPDALGKHRERDESPGMDMARMSN